MKTERLQSEVLHAKRRSGFFSLELALTLPILGVVLMALFEFSLLFAARGSVVEASRVGTRKACLASVSARDVKEEIKKVLPPRLQRGMQVQVDLGHKSGDVVAVAVSVPMNAAAPDLLWPIGYTLRSRMLYSETRMIKE